ncbi:NAD(P)-dependent oxidoreductase [Candidatus Solirubrobacter pratensis]|uniref:NAD(P)-dependent oxidoreductase n=1 Tax=Candidatus Solirubrobacter pratensis TaxID=1298857 RepID=UPI00040E8EEC|nr:NAD(P)-dependent oxidoreductase [Candidatus Solirubrobacter pratensis]
MRLWAPREHEAGLRAALPQDVELGRFADAEVMVPSYDTPEALEFIAGAPSLRMIQTLEAGVDWLQGRVPAHVTLCNARGVRDTPVAEWVLGMLLAHGKGLFEAAERRRWEYWQPRELAGSTVLIVGHGSIGAALARRLRALDANVIGVARTARDGLHAAAELPALLPEADAVVLLAPLTPETRGLAGREFFARMRAGALFVNAARGAMADTDALLEAVPRIRAALDVTDPEPLPEGHPLWTAPGVVISPHMAGDSPESFVRAYELVAAQVARLRAGEPLVNVVTA